MGKTHFNNGQWIKAIECFKSALNSSPANLHHEIMKLIGNAYHKMGILNNAIEYYGKALKIKPDYIDALYNLGGIYKELGNNKKALEYFKKVVNLDNNDIEAHDQIRLTSNNNPETVVKACYNSLKTGNERQLISQEMKDNIFVDLCKVVSSRNTKKPYRASLWRDMAILFSKLGYDEWEKFCNAWANIAGTSAYCRQGNFY